MIITTSYFEKPPLFVPNSTVNPAITDTTPNEVSDLQAVINRCEYELLFNSLGYEQYTELQGQFTPTGEWKPDALQKWIDLVDGKNEWTGLRFEIGGNKISLIAYYVYCVMLKEKRQYFATTGLANIESANATKINPTEEYVDKWNTFVCMYQGGYNYRYLNWWNPIFFEWNGYPKYSTNDNYMSLLQYLNNNTDLYDVSYFKLCETQNRFNI